MSASAFVLDDASEAAPASEPQGSSPREEASSEPKASSPSWEASWAWT